MYLLTLAGTLLTSADTPGLQFEPQQALYSPWQALYSPQQVPPACSLNPSRHSTHPGRHSTHPGRHSTHPGRQSTHPGRHSTHPGRHSTHPGRHPQLAVGIPAGTHSKILPVCLHKHVDIHRYHGDIHLYLIHRKSSNQMYITKVLKDSMWRPCYPRGDDSLRKPTRGARSIFRG